MVNKHKEEEQLEDDDEEEVCVFVAFVPSPTAKNSKASALHLDEKPHEIQ